MLRRTEQILQVAKSHLAAGDAESELKGSSTRRIQPVPKSTKPLVQYHKDLRYTPSPEDDIGSNLGSVRQISQTRSGGPSQAGAPRRSTRNVLPDKKSVDQDKVYGNSVLQIDMFSFCSSEYLSTLKGYQGRSMLPTVTLHD